MEIVPLAARTNPITALNSVDLPEPFTPTGSNRSARHAERRVAQRRVAVAVGHGHVGYNNTFLHDYSFIPSRMPCTSVRVVTFSRSI